MKDIRPPKVEFVDSQGREVDELETHSVADFATKDEYLAEARKILRRRSELLAEVTMLNRKGELTLWKALNHEDSGLRAFAEMAVRFNDGLNEVLGQPGIARQVLPPRPVGD